MPRFDNIGQVIRALRQERHLIQAELARRSGVSVSLLSNYERGLKTPSLGSLGKLLDAMDVHLGELDEYLDRINEREIPRPDDLAPGGVPEGVDLDRFLGYARVPEHARPVFAEMVAGFQSLTRHLARQYPRGRRRHSPAGHPTTRANARIRP